MNKSPFLEILKYVPEHGKSHYEVRCSNCSKEFNVYVWSLGGTGKKCPKCGHYYGRFDLKEEKKPKERYRK